MSDGASTEGRAATARPDPRARAARFSGGIRLGRLILGAVGASLVLFGLITGTRAVVRLRQGALAAKWRSGDLGQSGPEGGDHGRVGGSVPAG